MKVDERGLKWINLLKVDSGKLWKKHDAKPEINQVHDPRGVSEYEEAPA